jgi:hypothetical protein
MFIGIINKFSKMSSTVLLSEAVLAVVSFSGSLRKNAG